MKKTTSTWTVGYNQLSVFVVCANGYLLVDHTGQVEAFKEKRDAEKAAKATKKADKFWGRERKVEVKKFCIL